MKHRSLSLWLASIVSLTLLTAGCGATTAINTTIHPNGSGQVQWTIADTPGDMSQNAGLTIPQATKLLTKYAPTSATVSSPVLNSQGEEVWTITDSFTTVHQLNTILQSAVGHSNFSPVTWTMQGVPWAQSFLLHDPDIGNGHSFHWVSRGLTASNNSEASGWKASNGTQDLFTLPWRVPAKAPTVAQATANNNGNPPTLGIRWVKPTITTQWHPQISVHPSATELTGTWTMSFSTAQWQQLVQEHEASAMTHWWHQVDPHAPIRHSAHAVTWTAAIHLKPLQKNPWGTLNTTTLPQKPSTYWHTYWTTTYQFVPSSAWVLPTAWHSLGFATANGLNSQFQWHTQWPSALGQKLIHHTSILANVTYGSALWTGTITWQQLRWNHVVAVFIGILILIGILFAIRRALQQRAQQFQPCPSCHHLNLKTHQFCESCGAPMPIGNDAPVSPTSSPPSITPPL